MILLRSLLVGGLFLLSMVSFAQFYSTGPDPLRLHWQRLRGNDWTILSDSSAWRWAALANGVLERQVPLVSQDYPLARLRDLSVVVHSSDAFSNGLVSWAPRRLEAYAYDHGESDCVPWHLHLISHEMRHALQMECLRLGFSRGLFVLFGEQVIGLEAGLFVPKWFLEGDAVWAETQYTCGGRGRNGSWLQQMRSLAQDGIVPSYAQAYFGSYARRVPDYYHMGYYVVSDVCRNYGHKVWSDALCNVGRRPFTFVPFVRRLRQHTGERLVGSYERAMRRWTSEWARSDSARGARDCGRVLFDATKVSSDYAEAVAARPWRGGVVFYVSSPDVVPFFAAMDLDENECFRVATPAYRNETPFSLVGDTMVWSERRQHPRWDNASEECLMLCDLSSGRPQVSRLTTHGVSLHSPAIEPGRKCVAAVSIGPDLRHSLVMVDWQGQVRCLWTLPVGCQLSDLAWIDSRRVVGVLLSDLGKQIVSFDVENEEPQALLAPDFVNLSHLSVDGSRIFFTSDSHSGYNDIFSLSLADSLVRRHSVSRCGADYACPLADGRLLASVYSSRGFSLARLDSISSDVVAHVESSPLRLADDGVGFLRQNFERVGPMGVHLKPNVHSWGPVCVDADAVALSPGLCVSSQNAHGTVLWSAGMNWGADRSEERLFASVDWNWLLPRLSLSYTWGYADYFVQTMSRNESLLGLEELVSTLDGRSHRHNLSLSSSVPLSFNSGAWVFDAAPVVAFRREKWSDLDYVVDYTRWAMVRGVPTVVKHESEVRTVSGKNYSCVAGGATMSAKMRVAERDLGTRLGFSLSAYYDVATLRDDYGRMASLFASVYLPGIGRHHQFSISGQWQRKSLGRDTLASGVRRVISDRVAAPWGYSRLSNTSALLLRAAYLFPVVCPDLSVGPVVHVKRVNARPFVDFGRANVWGGHESLGISNRWSVGLDLWAESYWLLLPYPVSVGLRVAYLPTDRNWTCSSIFSMSF